MLVCFSSLAEFFNVIIPLSCLALKCGDKWKKENTRLLLFVPTNFDLVPGHYMTVPKHGMIWCRMKDPPFDAWITAESRRVNKARK